ncbi:MAG: hypothetical protein GY861_21185 [bacterium]|nr:hypothetical protein [bacterium]
METVIRMIKDMYNGTGIYCKPHSFREIADLTGNYFSWVTIRKLALNSGLKPRSRGGCNHNGGTRQKVVIDSWITKAKALGYSSVVEAVSNLYVINRSHYDSNIACRRAVTTYFKVTVITKYGTKETVTMAQHTVRNALSGRMKY